MYQKNILLFFSLKIVKIEPVAEALSESVVVGVMTQDEIRERIGLPPLEVNQEVMMSSIEDDIIIDQLHNTGFRVSELEVISTHVKEITSCEDAHKFEQDILIAHTNGRDIKEANSDVASLGEIEVPEEDSGFD